MYSGVLKSRGRRRGSDISIGSIYSQFILVIELINYHSTDYNKLPYKRGTGLTLSLHEIDYVCGHVPLVRTTFAYYTL